MSAAVKRQKHIYKKILIRDTHVESFGRLELNLIDTIITLTEDLLHDLEAPDKIQQEIENEMDFKIRANATLVKLMF